MSQPDYRAAHRARTERVALDGIVQRLASRFPELTVTTISRTVHGAYDDFRDSKIRDYVPILVERSALRELQQAAPHHRE